MFEVEFCGNSFLKGVENRIGNEMFIGEDVSAGGGSKRIFEDWGVNGGEGFYHLAFLAYVGGDGSNCMVVCREGSLGVGGWAYWDRYKCGRYIVHLKVG